MPSSLASVTEPDSAPLAAVDRSDELHPAITRVTAASAGAIGQRNDMVSVIMKILEG
jgi:hypothetical protein